MRCFNKSYLCLSNQDIQNYQQQVSKIHPKKLGWKRFGRNVEVDDADSSVQHLGKFVGLKITNSSQFFSIIPSIMFGYLNKVQIIYFNCSFYENASIKHTFTPCIYRKLMLYPKMLLQVLTVLKLVVMSWQDETNYAVEVSPKQLNTAEWLSEFDTVFILCNVKKFFLHCPARVIDQFW